MSTAAEVRRLTRERDGLNEECDCHAKSANVWMEKAIAAEREREAAGRALDALIHLIRQHRCNCDGIMPVGECIDSGRCGCSAALLARAINETKR
jgi:hypothetical protein